MNLREFASWLERQLIEHPEWKELPIISVEMWLPKTLQIEAHVNEGHVSIKQTDGYQEF